MIKIVKKIIALIIVILGLIACTAVSGDDNMDNTVTVKNNHDTRTVQLRYIVDTVLIMLTRFI